MPWTCRTCGGAAGDTVMQCPTCDAAKTSWTIVRDATRTLVVSARRFALLRGNDATARPVDQAAAVVLSPAEVVVALDKAQVRDWAARGLVPPSAHVLFVALHAGPAKDLTVSLELLFAGRPSEELSFPRGPAPSSEPVYARFAFVRGEGDLADVSFPDLDLVDVGEDGGVAPTVEVAALGRPTQALPVTATALRPFAFST